ncbi:hypothetical protein NEOCIP111885_04289 [Pseudoneobacillus rhizosphaerae]|jgi:hypothetical protein|uniref:Uncharacterized protein n=2 Tax=Pseudoneobacillus rhizosphaerae TaxID=2880968 RepID=A0A9C7GDH1_9BACI|nr:hypothetical protein NEOCIP111885_04289 [Pseudoneobacillus rhizosphaerae]
MDLSNIYSLTIELGGECMGRYVSIFFLTTLIIAVLFFTLPLLLGDILGEIEIIIGTLLVFLGSFIITQLFYIIDLLKKNCR